MSAKTARWHSSKNSLPRALFLAATADSISDSRSFFTGRASSPRHALAAIIKKAARVGLRQAVHDGEESFRCNLCRLHH